ncbi:20782_t:CDS:1, partial [Dentiscutata erythropus]
LTKLRIHANVDTKTAPSKTSLAYDNSSGQQIQQMATSNK